MAQYTAASYAASGTLVSSPNSGVNNEFRTIAAAHNVHAAADIATAASVSRDALICDKSYFSMVLTTSATITGAPSSSTIQAYCVVPFNCQVVAGFACTLATPTGADQLMHIYKEGDPDARLFPAAQMYGIYDVINMVPLMSTLDAGDVLTMRISFATTADTSAINVCSILAKAVHD